MVVPKKQDFWPKTDILKGNNCNCNDSLSKIEVIKKKHFSKKCNLKLFLNWKKCSMIPMTFDIKNHFESYFFIDYHSFHCTVRP